MRLLLSECLFGGASRPSLAVLKAEIGFDPRAAAPLLDEEGPGSQPIPPMTATVDYDFDDEPHTKMPQKERTMDALNVDVIHNTLISKATDILQRGLDDDEVEELQCAIRIRLLDNYDGCRENARWTSAQWWCFLEAKLKEKEYSEETQKLHQKLLAVVSHHAAEREQKRMKSNEESIGILTSLMHESVESTFDVFQAGREGFLLAHGKALVALSEHQGAAIELMSEFSLRAIALAKQSTL
jgi:hypothetical protein